MEIKGIKDNGRGRWRSKETLRGEGVEGEGGHEGGNEKNRCCLSKPSQDETIQVWLLVNSVHTGRATRPS